MLQLVQTRSIIGLGQASVQQSAAAALQLLLRHGGNRYMQVSRGFDKGFASGYRYEAEIGEYEEEELTFAALVEQIEQNLSYESHHRFNLLNQHLGMEPLPYAYHVGFTLGFFRWMFDAGREPAVPHHLLPLWYAVERLTTQVADR